VPRSKGRSDEDRTGEVIPQLPTKRQGSRPAFFYTRKMSGRYEDAARLFEEITTSDDYVEILTLPCSSG
jgi:hypothetical protein